jgi:hypothetical protein
MELNQATKISKIKKYTKKSEILHGGFLKRVKI